MNFNNSIHIYNLFYVYTDACIRIRNTQRCGCCCYCGGLRWVITFFHLHQTCIYWFSLVMNRQAKSLWRAVFTFIH